MKRITRSSSTHLDLVREELQLDQVVQALESSVVHDGDVVAVHVELGDLGQVDEHVAVDLGDEVLAEGERVEGREVGEGVASQDPDGVPGQRDLGQRARVAETEGVHRLEGGVLHLREEGGETRSRKGGE